VQKNDNTAVIDKVGEKNGQKPNNQVYLGIFRNYVVVYFKLFKFIFYFRSIKKLFVWQRRNRHYGIKRGIYPCV